MYPKTAKISYLLLPSINEALPISVMEALATGLPVVASAVGSMHELVDEGRSGSLVRSSDSKHIASTLEYLINHRELRPQMGRVGQAHVVANYNIEKLNDRLMEIYKGLLEK